MRIPTASATNAVVSGNNSVYGVTGFSAKGGWNACTGLGSPNGQKLLTLLSGSTMSDDTPVDPLPGAGQQLDGDGGADAMINPQPHAAQSFDPQTALLYGQFVQAAYSMYDKTPNSLTPAPSDFPPGYQLAAWVQMQDFTIAATGPTFYGFIAQSTLNPNRFVLALRGTENGVEWWDDANAIFKTPFKVAGCGRVGSGFARIYDTLEVIEKPDGNTAAAAPHSLRTVGGFSEQIADLIGRRAPLSARAAGFSASASVEITGHSLGAALATLYTMENARTNKINNPALCTFASPMVGDSTFVSAFNALGLTSWRIVNQPDIVSQLPPAILGFAHVNTLQQYSSIGKVQSSVKCWHSLATYLSLLEPKLQPCPGCLLPSARTQSEVVPAVSANTTELSVPAGASTINITIRVGDA